MNKQMIKIYWVDSVEQSGWVKHDPNTVLECESIGYLIEKNDTRIVIAKNHGGHSDNPSWGSYMSIPICAVKRITVLMEGGPML